MFLISTLFPPRVETFASALMAPSKLGSATPRFLSKSDNMLRKSRTSFGVSKSGSVTISTNGVPARL